MASAISNRRVKVSVVVRSKNEADWLRRCLVAVFNQDFPDLDVVLVDSGSTDATLDIAGEFPVRIVHCEGEYFPGKALNRGFEYAAGEFVACLSAHCIPVNDKWIERLLVCFHNPDVAGVYGRQEPLPDSSDIDKRDLWTVFGKEGKVQKEDYFFHNANSMIRRDVWDRFPFDGQLPSIEDQAWAKCVLAEGYDVVYEPHASVYHHHGIHQNLDAERAERVVKVIELLKRGRGSQ